MSRALILAPAVLLLALTACKKDGTKEQTASGQVLPGSISDAMLPEDRVTSHPPLDPGADRTQGGGGAAGPAGEGASAAAVETGAAAEQPKPVTSGAAD